MGSPPRVPVTFRWRGAPGLAVWLVGDFPYWNRPWRMAEEAPGEYALRTELVPGLYRYKFRVQGQWLLDPSAPVVDHAEGFSNGVMVVGGTLPPLFFAPDRRHLLRVGDRLILHCELAAEAAPPPFAWVANETGERQRLALRSVGQRGDRVQLRADGSLAGLSGGERAWLGFEGYPQWLFELPAPDAPQPTPRWLEGGVLYSIFLDRWRRARSSPAEPRSSPRERPSGPEVFYGGDLAGVAEGLDELLELGVDALVLTPVHLSESPHRYDAVSHELIDPRLGGEQALAGLLEAAHRRGLRVLADLSFTHVSERHPAFEDLLARQRASAYAEWFVVKQWPVRSRDGSTYAHYDERPDLPLLDLSGPAGEQLVEASVRLVRLGVDGLRLDAMADAPRAFWQKLRRRVKAVRPETVLLGEVVVDAAAEFWGEGGADVTYDFHHRELLRAFFGRRELLAQELLERLAFARHRLGPVEEPRLLSFLDNLDTPRFFSEFGVELGQLALAYLYFRPEPLALTYGTELEFASGVASFRFDDAWPERLPMPDETLPWRPTGELLAQLATVRRALDGPLRASHAGGRRLRLERATRGGRAVGLFNLDDTPWALADSERAGRVALTVGEVAPSAEAVGARAARVLWVER